MLSMLSFIYGISYILNLGPPVIEFVMIWSAVIHSDRTAIVEWSVSGPSVWIVVKFDFETRAVMSETLIKFACNLLPYLSSTKSKQPSKESYIMQFRANWFQEIRWCKSYFLEQKDFKRVPSWCFENRLAHSRVVRWWFQNCFASFWVV